MTKTGGWVLFWRVDGWQSFTKKKRCAMLISIPFHSTHDLSLLHHSSVLSVCVSSLLFFSLFFFATISSSMLSNWFKPRVHVHQKLYLPSLPTIVHYSIHPSTHISFIPLFLLLHYRTQLCISASLLLSLAFYRSTFLYLLLLSPLNVCILVFGWWV